MKSNSVLYTSLLLLLTTISYAQNTPIKDSCITASKALSVNGDSKLHVYGSCDLSDFKFTLYNRWGKEVYTTNKFTDPLDLDIVEKVKVNGKLAYKYPSGTYVWSATYVKEIPEGPSKRLSTGSLTIISPP